ncbi:homeobox-domain-containing protein [Neoconidiobolus thromboides FSU 785]|nr:homeobox-domain-containing protein [Neoconidiobolus thromboides FSU 785]
MNYLNQFSLSHKIYSYFDYPNDLYSDIKLPELKNLTYGDESLEKLPSMSELINWSLLNNHISPTPYHKRNRSSVYNELSSNSIYSNENLFLEFPGMRVRKSLNQVDSLERAYMITPFPNRSLRVQLAKSLNLKPRTIQIWFQNRRQKAKRSNSISSN